MITGYSSNEWDDDAQLIDTHIPAILATLFGTKFKYLMRFVHAELSAIGRPPEVRAKTIPEFGLVRDRIYVPPVI